MNLEKIIKQMKLVPADDSILMNKDIICGYCSDMLSDVMGNAKENSIWITLQTHQNIVGVAVMKDMAAIIIVNDRKPEANTLKKAKFQNIPILLTPLTAFEVCGLLYQLGLKS
ncbi:MAG: hypothetical protein A2Y62_17655 [Candidatus Fischerbacteria bacterium RBG_13_37_8]|uniref:Serine kinase n=1 Tax=Candidatus Fischerbacteria bacterium RBG_13_37_8 TaxID=1817863 RepID=A0A1F5VP80_9BACT|nr:MAG: hypothetical protein A2Y62_17655 [Candidatus Fischerbacteria bacterium RBG_13_37_8]